MISCLFLPLAHLNHTTYRHVYMCTKHIFTDTKQTHTNQVMNGNSQMAVAQENLREGEVGV